MTSTFHQLLDKFIRKDIDSSELQQFLGQAAFEDNLPVLEACYDALLEQPDLPGSDHSKDLDLLFAGLMEQLDERAKAVAKVKSMVRYRRWMAAACIVLLAGIGIYFFTITSPSSKPYLPITSNEIVAPVNNKAQITLSDGRIVYLEQAGSGAIAKEADVTVVKATDGAISYVPEAEPAGENVTYNRINNPRGSQVVQLKLSDGTTVWLNSGTELIYPTSFAGKERRVELKGEGYFEVAHNAGQPFIVHTQYLDTKVLGTHFNVNSYQDEPAVNVTLLEGKVEVLSNQSQRLVLEPGEQASQFMRDDEPLKKRTVNTAHVIAWKDGFFAFSNATLVTILRQAARWYNIEISVEPGVENITFSGKIGRSLSLQHFLNILDKTRIHYRIESNKLIIHR